MSLEPGETNRSLSEGEITLAAQLMKRVPDGFAPEPIFLEAARIFVLGSLQMAPLRMRDGRVEVLLLRRPSTDKLWGNMLDIPGTIIRATDQGENFEGAIERLLKEEMGNPIVIQEPVIFGVRLRHSVRGTEIMVMSRVEIAENIRGEFYSVDNLPRGFISAQQDFLDRAVQDLKTQGIISSN